MNNSASLVFGATDEGCTLHREQARAASLQTLSNMPLCTLRDKRSALLITLATIYITLTSKEMANVSLPTTLPVLVTRFVGPVDTSLPAIASVFYSLGKFIVATVTQAIGAQ